MNRYTTTFALLMLLIFSSFSFAQSQKIASQNLIVGIDSILASVDQDTWVAITQDISAEIGENVEIPGGSIF